MSTTKPQPHVPSPECPASLATADLDLHYLAEGAANIIYGVSVRSPSTLRNHSHCCVMRLRKDLPSTKPVVQVTSEFESRIAPLFANTSRGGPHDSLLLTQSLYRLTPAMVRDLNDELHEMETENDPHIILSSSSSSPDTKNPRTGLPSIDRRHPPRPHHRRHKYLPSYEHEQYGVLMQNLQGPSIDRLVEFKPKWLVQSPSAPSGAKSCRTCALNAMRRSGSQSHQGRGDSGFCPLDLLEQDHVLNRALDNIWPVELSRGEAGAFSGFVAQFKAKVQPALYHLRRLQREHGAVGIHDFLNPSLVDGDEFGLAMALRDCSCFVALKRCQHHDNATVNVNEDGVGGDTDGGGGGDGVVVDVIDVKFADLDLKSTGGGKLEKWAAMEQSLLDGGWYTRSDLGCALSRV
ncbi:hypothetical protein PV08_07699 [Exophiala spinifera]|uniref:Inositol-pentakisphosphate 2-kinase n=1 Tax=Exophiala spinifera TaxID=91928 RepID=A0A0D2BUJ1_9EURO|nr:uncharacterized protein PV08_07699 [Exophiala spinifera]KIW14914.1 hypothetical protein PV08_07699 [Exophiala spinifera]